MTQSELDEYVPVPVHAAFEALRLAVSRRFTLTSVDHFTKTVSFSGGASLFTWGEHFIAQVMPSGKGSTIRVVGWGKVGGQLENLVAVLLGVGGIASTNTGKAQNARLHELITALFDDISSLLREDPTTSS
jgi:hypothetical protein